jgi:hypothetical protein
VFFLKQDKMSGSLCHICELVFASVGFASPNNCSCCVGQDVCAGGLSLLIEMFAVMYACESHFEA